MEIPVQILLAAGYLGLLTNLAASETDADAVAAPWDHQPAFSVPAAELLSSADATATDDEDDAHVFLRSMEYQIDTDGRVTTRYHEIYRLLSRNGVRNRSTIEARWQPWYENRPVITSRVITSAGETFTLDPKTIAEVPVRHGTDILTDEKELRAPLPAASRGAIVEYVVETSEHRPFFAGGAAGTFAFASSFPVDTFRVTIQAPREVKVQHGVEGDSIAPEVTTDGEVQRIVYEKTDNEKIKSYDYFAPPDYIPFPRVRFTTVASWADVAKAYHEIVERQLDDLSAIQTIVASTITKGQELSRKETANRLLARLNDLVRYTGVEFGEAAIVPRTPAQTLARRYGDCKDQSTFLVALLREAGIDAHVALLYAAQGSDISPDFPAMNAFNHAIVYVPGDEPLWIDPTVEFAGAGELPTVDQFRFALVASADTTQLTRTPHAAADENRVIKRREFRLSDSELATLVISSTGYGVPGQQMRTTYGMAKRKDIEQRWEDYARDQYDAKKVIDIDFSDTGNVDQPFTTSATLVHVNRAIIDDSEVTIYLSPEWVTDQLPYELTATPEEYEDEEPRRAPLWLSERFVADLQFRVIPPAGYVPVKLPDDERHELGGDLTLTRTAAIDDSGVVQVDYKLHTGAGRFEAKEVATVREKLYALHEGDDISDWHLEIRFQETAARLLGEGKVAEAIAEYRNRITDEPNNPVRHVRLAEALLTAGLGDLARESAQKAVEIAADNAIAQRVLGNVLMHNRIGQYLRRGFDLAGAEAALRRSIEIDDEDHRAPWTLAILLEHDENGFRYCQTPRLDEAIEIYQGLIEEMDDEDLRDNLIFAMLYNQEFKSLGRLLKKSDETPTREALQAALLAIGDGVNAASKFIGRAAESQEHRTTYYSHATTYLNSLRYYDEALALIEKMPQQDATTRQTATTLRALKHLDDNLIPQSEPAHVVQEFLKKVVLFGPYSSEVQTQFDQFDITSDKLLLQRMPARFASTFRTAIETEARPERLQDALTLLKYETDHDGNDGFRVQVTSADGESCWFVLRDGERFQLWNPGEFDQRIGDRAWQLIDDGKMDTARQWLKWSYQFQKTGMSWFDAFSGPPFARFWLLGKTSQEQTLRIAAAMLMGMGEKWEQAAEMLVDARENVAANDVRLLQIDRALVAIYLKHKQYEAALPIIDQMIRENPTRETPVANKLAVLTKVKKNAEAILLAKEHLANRSRDDHVRYLLGQILLDEGQFVLGAKELGKLADGSRFKGAALNSLAWATLFLDESPNKVDSEAKAIAEKAIHDAMTSARTTGVGGLHTLACIHAHRGEIVQARDAITRSVDIRGYGPLSQDLYVFGRIAEHCGFPDQAAEFYRGVLANDFDEEGSLTTPQLARQRLQALLKE